MAFVTLILLTSVAFVPTVPNVIVAPDRFDNKAAAAFAKRWFEARPATRFDDWDEELRAALLADAEQLRLPEGALDDAVEELLKAAKKRVPRARKKELDTPFGRATWLDSGTGKNKGLVIGLHGGGEGAGSASEATRWQAKGCRGMYPQGIRLVHDTWNTVHGERFVLTLMEIAKVHHEVDPDRVYSMGFSMGGTGSWFLAGRHPDLLAGSSPCAGVLMANPKSQLETKEEVEALQHGFVPNVRNLSMYYYIGLADKNCMPGTYLYVWDRIEALRAADPEGYRDLEFSTYPGLAHAFPPGEPTKGIKWLTAKVRNTFPDKLVWEYASDPFPQSRPQDARGRLDKNHYYWLYTSAPVDRMEVTATRAGNAFDLTIERADPSTFRLFLRPEMIDVEEDVVVTVNGEEGFRGRATPSFRALVESFDDKLDRSLVFDRCVPLLAD